MRKHHSQAGAGVGRIERSACNEDGTAHRFLSGYLPLS